MTKLWRIAAYEYRRNVFKKGFIFVLSSVPLMMAINIGVGFLIENLKDSGLPVGYVDQADVLTRAIPAPVDRVFDEPVAFVSFQTEEEARTSLEAGEIQAYYVLPPDYTNLRRIRLVYIQEPGENAMRQFFDFLQINLITGQPAETAYRAAAGPNVTISSMDGRRHVSSRGPTFDLLMPLLIAIAFLVLLLVSSNYLMSAVADEKENRTIEILVTSVSPMQIIGGKIAGIIAIGLTALVTWAVVVALGIFIAAQAGIGWFQNMTLDWSAVLTSVAIAIPAYALVAGLMTAIGAMVTTTQEGQSLATIFVFLHIIPVYVAVGFLNNPNNALAVTLSLLPFTSLMIVSVRNLFVVVPAWQVAVSVCVQILCAVGACWLASRAFRLGMLRYGQRLSFRSLFASRHD